MANVQTTKLEELIRRYPKNSGLDPRLVEEAKTELNVLRVKAEANSQRQSTWMKTETDKLKNRLLQKESEIAFLRQQLNEGVNGRGGSLNTDRCVSIKGRYMGLYDTGWSDAYDFFRSQGWTEVEIIVTLQRILRASYSVCRDVAKEQLENLEGEALYPTASWMDDEGILNRMNKKQITKEIAQIARLYQNTTAQECLPAIQKAFAEQVLPTFIDPLKIKSPIIKNYAETCVEVTWYMCVQNPPMVIVDRFARGSEFNPDLFRKYTKYGGDKYDYLVWPALLLHEGGPVVVKGVAKTIPTRQGTELSERSTRGIPTPRQSAERSREQPREDDEYEDTGYQSPVYHRNTSRGDRTTNVTPAKVYKKAPENDDRPDHHTPFFDPHGRGDIPRINIVPTTSDALKTERSKHGNTNRKSATTYFGKDGPYVGDEARMPSAP